jgi:DNA invertase Pin-like site-specific DNA recombinase
VALVVIDQAIDTSTPAGRLLFNVLGSIAEFERDLIRERVTAGLAAAKRRGQTLGRPKALDARGAARVRRLRDSGHSLRAIAAKVGVGLGTVQRVLAG